MSRFAWEPLARAGLRSIDREQALIILQPLDRFGKTGYGDVRTLIGDKQDRSRLRVGNWRIILRREGPDAFRVYSVDDRKNAY